MDSNQRPPPCQPSLSDFSPMKASKSLLVRLLEKHCTALLSSYMHDMRTMEFTMSRLTKQFIESIQPSLKHRDYPDHSFQGLTLRCHPSGKKTYYYRYRFNSRQRSVALGTSDEISPTVARELASEAAVMVRRGKCPSTCLLYTSPSPRDLSTSRMPSSA